MKNAKKIFSIRNALMFFPSVFQKPLTIFAKSPILDSVLKTPLKLYIFLANNNRKIFRLFFLFFFSEMHSIILFCNIVLINAAIIRIYREAGIRIQNMESNPVSYWKKEYKIDLSSRKIHLSLTNRNINYWKKPAPKWINN